MSEMPEQWTREAARQASEAQQGLFKAELEPVVLDETTSDKLAAPRALLFMFAGCLVAGVVIAVLVLW